jgi:hypothetical protein
VAPRKHDTKTVDKNFHVHADKSSYCYCMACAPIEETWSAQQLPSEYTSNC